MQNHVCPEHYCAIHGRPIQEQASLRREQEQLAQEARAARLASTPESRRAALVADRKWHREVFAPWARGF